MDEFELIRRISQDVPRSGQFLVQGIDDDAAVIEGPGNFHWLVTTDLLTEGVHFRREWCDWETLGKKALLVNLSDIAAMGGNPRFYFVSIGIPEDVPSSGVEEIFNGMRAVGANHQTILAGGDTSSSKKGLFISITAMGLVEKNRAIYRKGAKAGDRIFVSGALGGAAAGQACLEMGLKDYSAFIKRHLLPEPRLKLAAFLSKNQCASSMIDISDGLKRDLDHIADLSSVGYRLYYEKIPVDTGVENAAKRLEKNLQDIVMAGGEDYELLFTMSPEQEKRFFGLFRESDWGCPITSIGEIVDNPKTRLIWDRDHKEIMLEKSGFVHNIR